MKSFMAFLMVLMLVTVISADGVYIQGGLTDDVPLPPEDLEVRHYGGVKEPGFMGDLDVEIWSTEFTGPYGETVPVDIYYPADGENGPYPVIIQFNGFMMANKGLAMWCEYYASWGYVVSAVHLQYMRAVNLDLEKCAYEVLANIDFLVEMGEEPGSPIEGLVDGERCGLTGYSLGGKVGLMADVYDSRQGNDRIKAISTKAMAIMFQPDLVPMLDEVTTPVQIQTGDKDEFTPPDNNSQVVYDNMNNASTQYVLIAGANHEQYQDDETFGSGLVDGDPEISREEQHRIGRRYSTAFFNYYIKGETGYGEYLYGEYAQQDVEEDILVFNDFKHVDYVMPEPGKEHNLITWRSGSRESVSHYNVYRSADQDGPYELIASVDSRESGEYRYLDMYKGTGDDIWWWYVVRTVDADGVEEENDNAVREPGENQAPFITLTRPNGGEIFDGRGEEEITWSTEAGDDPIDGITLRYSADGGETWNTIVEDIPDQGTYLWTVPNHGSTTCLVRAVVRDTSGSIGLDTSDQHFSIEGVSPLPPVNLTVEHGGIDETLDNGMFHDDHSPWVLNRTVDGGEARWDDEHFEEGGSIYVRAEAIGEFNVSTEDSYWEQEIRPVSEEVVLTGAFRKVLFYGSGWRWETFVHDARVEVLLYDTSAGWQSVFVDDAISVGDTGWVEFETNGYEPLGQVNAVRLRMHAEAEGDTGPQGGLREARAELWMDNMSMIAEGTVDNLISWDPSPEDRYLSHYNVYRSESKAGPWDTPIAAVEADGSIVYGYQDMGAGTADQILWWYVVRAVGAHGMEEENVHPVREPSTDVEVFDIPLHAGWNFVSFNLVAVDSSLGAILDDPGYGISGSYDRVMYYDSSAGRWYSHLPGRPDHYNNIHTWDHTMGIWIRVTEDVTLSVQGVRPGATDVTLYTGWNMVGLPSSTAGNHDLPSEVTRIGYFDVSQEYNIAYTEEVDTFVFSPGKGYWVYNSGNVVTWTVEFS